MRTIEEYQEYCKQLEGEVKKWHDAYDASEFANSQLAAQIKPLQNDIKRLNIELELARKSNKAAQDQIQSLIEDYNELLDKNS